MPVCEHHDVKRLLIIEDDPDLQRVLAVLLAGQGCAVSTAASPAQAIAACQAHKPDLIVLDLTLSNGQGSEVLGWLQAKQQDPIVVIYTAQDLPEAEYQHLQSVAKRIFVKSRVDPLYFQQTVFQLLYADYQPLSPAPEP